MPHYAATLGRDPEATYRKIDIVGRTGEADPYQLVQLMYEELGRALRAAASAVEQDNAAVRADKVTRAISILFALEAGLDHDRAPDLSKTLGGLYRGARRTVIDASLGSNPQVFRDVADNLDQIADAWRSLRPR